MPEPTTPVTATGRCWRVSIQSAGFHAEKVDVDTWDQAIAVVLDQLMARGPRVTRIELRTEDVR